MTLYYTVPCYLALVSPTLAPPVYQSPGSRRRKKYRHGVDSPPLGYYASDGATTRAQRSGDEGRSVVAYDAYHRRWVPVTRRELEQAALEKGAAATSAARVKKGGRG